MSFLILQVDTENGSSHKRLESTHSQHNLTIELSHHRPTTLYTIRKPQSLLQCRSMITISQCPNLQVVKKKKAMSTHNVLRNLHM